MKKPSIQKIILALIICGIGLLSIQKFWATRLPQYHKINDPEMLDVAINHNFFIYTDPASMETDTRKFGFIKSIRQSSDSKFLIVVDEAEYYGSEEADAASKIDNGCNASNSSSECSIPNAFSRNPFWIRNLKEDSTEYVVTMHTKISLYSWGVIHGDIELRSAELTELVDRTKEMYGHGVPAWLTFKDGVIIQIDEQYLP